MKKQFLEKYDPDEIAQLGNYIHALISSDATTPSKATKEYIDTRFENLFNRLKEYFDISLIKLESRVEKGNSDLLTHIEKEDTQSKSVFDFIKEMKPILERFKNNQGFWSVLNNSGRTIVFLASVIVASGTCIFFFYKIGKMLIEHGF